MRGAWITAAAVAALAAAFLAAPAIDRGADLRTDAPLPPPQAVAVARGEALARIGHCAGCHTARGGEPYAGGRPIATPFGTVVAANLTPDPDTGLGRWSAAAFRRALREGRSADGRPLLPACPYPNFALVTDADADDLFAWLRSLPAQAQPRPPHALRWPYALPQALLAWRWHQGVQDALPAPPPSARGDWRRGAYLVGGLGHCSACHGRRDAWGATAGAFDLRGGEIAGQGWFAPSLADPREAAVSGWSEDEVVALLRDGRNRHATVSGPMAMVVAHSAQHWPEADLRAAAEFLRQLPPPPAAAAPAPPAPEPPAAQLQRGERLYADHCADCHGRDGEGSDDDGPPLAGNRAVALASPANLLRVVLGGGFGPSTAAHPRPWGMPPFATTLGDDDLAAIVTHVRWRFGARSSGVTTLDVNRQR